MQGFFVLIKLKITTALSEWKPDSPVAQQLITPWLEILDRKSIDNILMRSVVPKLISQLKQIEIDPTGQDIKPL